MDFLRQVTISIRTPPARGHEDNSDDECYGALTHVDADIFNSSKTKKIGSISAILVDRQKIPNNCFYETFDEHSSDMEWVGTSIMENRYGRTRLSSLQYYDDPEFDFMYITSFDINDTVTANKNDIVAAALYKFLHEPTTIKGNSDCWKVSSAAYVVCVPNAEPSSTGSTKRKRGDDDDDERAATTAAEPFLRNGFFQDPALVRRDLDNQRLLVASYGDWSKDIRPIRQLPSLKFFSKPPAPKGKDHEILLAVQQAVQNDDPFVGGINMAAIMIGQATYQPPGDPVSADKINTLRSQLQRLKTEGGSIARSTALHVACENNSPNAVKLLLDLDSRAINVKNESLTPLMNAAKNAAGRLSINGIDDTKVIDYLLFKGADKSSTDSIGLTAYGHFREASAVMIDITHQHCRSKLVLLESKLCPPNGPTQVDMAGGTGGSNSGLVDYGPEDEMEVTKKVSSTEAYQAFTPVNMFKAELFWARRYPLGVVGVPRRQLIDVDEFRMDLNRCNDKHGYSLSVYRVRKPGHCQRVGSFLSVFYAIEAGDPRLPPHVMGSLQHPRHWIQVLQNQGATEITYGQFIEYICNDIEQRPVGHINTDAERVFIWDNLNVHNSPRLFQIVEGRNYLPPAQRGPTRWRIIPRPPYQAKYGPIEYKICGVVQDVQRKARRDWTDADLEQAIVEAAGRVTNVDGAFAHCGYTADGVY